MTFGPLHMWPSLLTYGAGLGEWSSAAKAPGRWGGTGSSMHRMVTSALLAVAAAGAVLIAFAFTAPSAGAAPAPPGAQLWFSRYNGPEKGVNMAGSVSVRADATKVFVTGDSSGGLTTNVDYATVAYNAATGEELWVSRYNGPGNGSDAAMSVAASPD